MKSKAKLCILALASSHLMFANLVSTGLVADSGSGLGAVSTLFTVTSAGSSTTESGCVGWDGSSTVTNSSICPNGFVGGDNQAINNTYTLASLGLNNFDSIQLIFNASEPGGNSITLENLALTLFDSNGTLLAAYTIPAPITFDVTLTGVGNAGFGFQLDAAQYQLANQYLNVAGLHIGAALTASSATGGHETLFIRSINDGGIPPNETGVPEPATYAGVGLALVGLETVRRKQKSDSQ